MADEPFADTAAQPLILTIPGFRNSGPTHWQSLWERERGDCRRVDLGMWDRPHRNTWVNQLNLAIHKAGRRVILVAHSLGCHAVAWWAHYEQPGADGPVAGALLVAPPDVDRLARSHLLACFAPVPEVQLPFPAIVAGSRNDHYITLKRARAMARGWGASFADAGAIGHINADSGIGAWPFGQFLLDQLIHQAAHGQPAAQPDRSSPLPPLPPAERVGLAA